MDLLGPLYRVHVLVRLALVALTLVINLVRLSHVAMPVVTVACCVFMVGWTLVTSWWYLDPRRRVVWVFVADLAVTLIMIFASVVVIGVGSQISPPLSLPGYWIAGAPLAVALWRGWRWGLAAGVVVALADGITTVAMRPWGWISLTVMVLTCLAVGYIRGQLVRTTTEREQMYAVAAAMAERQRLSRIVHDGVLQVLAMVERDGRSLGPRGTWLAHQAHEQELALRALLQDTAIDVDSRNPLDETHANLAALLDRHATSNVTVSAPAGVLLVDAVRAREIDAAVREALTNVARHAGPEARAWVLLEREGDEVLVSIRDNGVGATATAFEEAVRRGRMGTRHSIHGRLHDLGGSATLRTAPGEGLEWEFRVPVGE